MSSRSEIHSLFQTRMVKIYILVQTSTPVSPPPTPAGAKTTKQPYPHIPTQPIKGETTPPHIHQGGLTVDIEHLTDHGYEILFSKIMKL